MFKRMLDEATVRGLCDDILGNRHTFVSYHDGKLTPTTEPMMTASLISSWRWRFVLIGHGEEFSELVPETLEHAGGTTSPCRCRTAPTATNAA